MPRRVFEGLVVSDVNNKTVVVKVETKIKHPVYKKYILRSSKYSAHDPENSCKMGEIVKIIEGKPVSKTKRWHVLYETQMNNEEA
jgi:small subunit ribosomal protein S17